DKGALRRSPRVAGDGPRAARRPEPVSEPAPGAARRRDSGPTAGPAPRPVPGPVSGPDYRPDYGRDSGPGSGPDSGPEDDWDDDEDYDEESPSFLQNLWGGVKEILIIAVMALVLSFVVKTWLIQAFYIPSGSMENTLVRDDRVIVSKLTPGPFDLNRGDVVVFKDPGNWLGTVPESREGGPRETLRRVMQFVGLVPDDSDDHLIKRVIGMPGDHVVCCDKDGKLTINGVAVSEPYVRQGDNPGGGKPNFDITVPSGRVWVMGDHRSDSSDSRFHDDGTGATGSVPIEDITGRAVMVVWPIDHVTWLSVPERVYADVPPASGQPTSTPASTGATG
ncbi:MAG TPA: signal peptidase I, partial [Lapillicoccus sp.]|nr:signal peptidase I [Lapillicoccus sp.]